MERFCFARVSPKVSVETVPGSIPGSCAGPSPLFCFRVVKGEGTVWGRGAACRTVRQSYCDFRKFFRHLCLRKYRLPGGRRVPIMPSNTGALSSFSPVAGFAGSIPAGGTAEARSCPAAGAGLTSLIIQWIFQVGDELCPAWWRNASCSPFIAGNLDCRNRSLAIKGYGAQKNQETRQKDGRGCLPMPVRRQPPPLFLFRAPHSSTDRATAS